MTHLGLALFATDLTTDIRDVARAAEDAGFESLFVAEHTHIPSSRRTPYPVGGELPPEYSRTLDPFLALTAAAAVTERLRLGTGVCLVVERDPIVTAKEVSTLDVLSAGRVLLGVGAGWNVEEMAQHGTAFDTRWELLRERVNVMRALWTEEEASYAGRFAQLEPSWQWPKPVQPHLPVLVGGGGRRAMQLALDLDGGWMPMPSREKFADRLAALRALADEAGKPVPPVTVYAGRPEREVVEHYSAMGIERVVFLLPTRGDALGPLRAIAAATAAAAIGAGGAA
jgi:probable F420-dependent oxidoreductase